MKRKIEWYKEVLSLEPGSKVFFPLARLYAECGQNEEAIAVLRQGGERHPEHLEARFLLLELMDGAGAGEEASREAAGLGELLARYPAFWRRWADSLTPDSPDAALALRILSLHLGGESVRWAQIMERGLQSYAAETAPAVQATAAAVPETAQASDVRLTAEAAPCPSPSLAVDAPAEIGEFLAERSVDASAPPPVGEPVEAAELAAVETLLGGMEEAEPLAKSEPPAAPEGLSEPAYEDVDDFALTLEDEARAAEPVPAPVAALGEADELADEPEIAAKSSDEASLRTATMAEILAGQGDFQAALDIYRELRTHSESPEQARRAAERMEELEALLGHASSGVQVEEPAAKVEAPEAERGRVKKKLMGALGALANRLEARSGSDG